MKTKYSYLQRGAKTILLTLSTATLFTAAPAVWADSPSDLMEQGVYSEETKGDLTGAEQLYQQVITQAKEERALAARAQYHLGVCYYKQNNFTDADTAFKTVVKDYSDQKDIAALAQKYLAGAHPLQPAPWTDGEEMRLDLALAGGMKVGMADYRVDSGTTTNGQKIWRCSSHMAIGGIQSLSHVEVDAATFSPIHSFWKHSLLGAVDAVYYSDHADLKTVGKDEITKLSFDSSVIDNEECIEWMRRLPLANGYTNNQAVLASLGSHVVPVAWSVSGPESVTVPAGTYPCYKVELSISQAFWYSADTNRYLVKFEGGGVVAELATVAHNGPGEGASYTDVTNGFSLTAPGGWSFDRNDSENKSETDVQIIDPEALAVSSLTVQSLDTLEPDEKKSLKDYVNQKVERSGKMFKDFKTRPDTGKARTIAGQPAVSVIADYTEGKAKKVLYGVYSFGPTNGVYFQMMTSAKDFDALQPTMDSIINSYKPR